MSNHTKEKWELIKHNGTNLYGAKGQNNDWFVFENALEKDAIRIVACVNACEGIIDPIEYMKQMDQSTLSAQIIENQRLQAERNELLEVVKQYLALYDEDIIYDLELFNKTLEAINDKMKSLVDKIEGGK